jgi:hypothetical protein
MFQSRYADARYVGDTQGTRGLHPTSDFNRRRFYLRELPSGRVGDGLAALRPSSTLAWNARGPDSSEWSTMKSNWYSVYGTGASLYGIERRPDGRVEFTVWLSLLWMPLVPLSSWSAHYVGEGIPAIPGESHWFRDLERIPHNGARLAKTFLKSVLLVAAALVPIAVMLARTEGRAATTLEIIIVFACTLWAAGLPIYVQVNRGKKLRTGNFTRLEKTRDVRD